MICTTFDRHSKNNLAQAQCKFQKPSCILTIVWFGHILLNGAFLQTAVSLQMQRPGLLTHSYAGLCCCCHQYCHPTFCFCIRLGWVFLSGIDNRWLMIDKQRSMIDKGQSLFLDSRTCCLWKTLGGLIFQWNTKSPKTDHLPVETPGGSRMGDRKKVQIWTQKQVACGHTLRIWDSPPVKFCVIASTEVWKPSFLVYFDNVFLAQLKSNVQ